MLKSVAPPRALMASKPKVVFDVNFFDFRYECGWKIPENHPICRSVREWVYSIERGDVEAIVPSGVEEVLAYKNLKKGRDDAYAGLRGLPVKREQFEDPIISWMRAMSSRGVKECLGSADEESSECARLIDREDLAIYAQASKAGADYIVTGDRAWYRCQHFFREACRCLEEAGERRACGAKLPRIIPITKPPGEALR